jgi:hypothetical protein
MNSFKCTFCTYRANKLKILLIITPPRTISTPSSPSKSGLIAILLGSPNGKGRGFSIDDEHDQNSMLAKQACVDGISKDKVANILLSFNRKNRLDDAFNDEEEHCSEGENKRINLKPM